MRYEDLVATVTRHWCEVLEVEAVTPADNFFELGGDSLAAMELVVRLTEDIGVDVPADVLFIDGSFAGIVAAAAAQRQSLPRSTDDSVLD